MSNEVVETEIWKQTPNDPALEASNLGHIRYKDTHELVKLKHLTANQYPSYESHTGDHPFNFVHKTVALTWCENPNPAKYKIVDHIDGNPANSRADNLRWCDRSMNAKYAYARKKELGIEIIRKRFTDEEAKQMRLDHLYGMSICQLALKHGVGSGNMSAIINNKVYRDPEWFAKKADIIKEKLFTEIDKGLVTSTDSNCLNWDVRGLCFTIYGVAETAIKNLGKLVKDWPLNVKFKYTTIDQDTYECIIY